MDPNYTCTICGAPVVPHQVTFVQDGRLWSIGVPICKAKKCLEKRGAAWVDHRAEKKALSAPVKESQPCPEPPSR